MGLSHKSGLSKTLIQKQKVKSSSLLWTDSVTLIFDLLNDNKLLKCNEARM